MSIKIKGRLKSKLISVIFLVLSIGITYYIFTSAQKTRQIMHVPVLNKELEYGIKISESDLEMKEVGVYNMPSKIVREKDEIIGKYAATNLKDARYIYTDDLMNEKPAMTVKEKIKSGAVAVETDLMKCVGGIPEPGDFVKVNIIINDRDTDELIVYQDPILNKVEILALQNASGEYLKDARSKKESGFSTTSKAAKPALIIFDVTAEQEKALLKGLYIGRLHLSLVPLAKTNIKSEKIDTENEVVNNINETITAENTSVETTSEGITDESIIESNLETDQVIDSANAEVINN